MLFSLSLSPLLMSELEILSGAQLVLSTVAEMGEVNGRKEQVFLVGCDELPSIPNSSLCGERTLIPWSNC